MLHLFLMVALIKMMSWSHAAGRNVHSQMNMQMIKYGQPTKFSFLYKVEFTALLCVYICKLHTNYCESMIYGPDYMFNIVLNVFFTGVHACVNGIDAFTK